MNHALKPANGASIQVDITIAIDATSSMDPYIEGVVRAVKRFMKILLESNLDIYLGLVVFRDELCGEKTHCYSARPDFEAIKAKLNAIVPEGGGDIPESALPGIRYALNIDGCRDGARKLVLLITDAPCHDPEDGLGSDEILERLQEDKVVLFACAPPVEPYKRLVNATQGTLFPITSELSADAFKDVMLAVAYATVKTMRVSEADMPKQSDRDDARKTLRF